MGRTDNLPVRLITFPVKIDYSKYTQVTANKIATFSLYYMVMKKSLVLAIILASLFSALVTGCAQPVPPKDTLAPPQAIPVPSPETSPTGFYLAVTQPVDGGIVNVDKVEVRGSTSPGAVVSVNDEIALADTQGVFTVTISLEEGPNIIEVIASDEEGNEATTSLVVTLVKGG